MRALGWSGFVAVLIFTPRPRRRAGLRVAKGRTRLGMSKKTRPLPQVSGGLLGAGTPTFLTTKVDYVVNWARRNSLWPMPFGTACCAIEMMASAASNQDLARFGMERMAFSPRQADVLICAGRVPYKLAPVLRRIWDQMPQPKWWRLHGSVRLLGRRLRRLLHGAGDRHHHPGGRLRARLSAAAGGAHLRSHDDSGKSARRVAGAPCRAPPRGPRRGRAPPGPATPRSWPFPAPFGNSTLQESSGGLVPDVARHPAD